MDTQQLLHPQWDLEDIRTTFFKCVRWQVEETMEPTYCPYHYFCDSVYPGNYPPSVDVLVLLFTAISYLATLVLMVIDISRRGRVCFNLSNRYFLPSGPISLPIILLMLAKGHRINTVFPLSCIGPAILQLVYISALTFDYGAADHEDVKYAFFETSTISGILHASLYLDSVVLPYYTGFDAMVSSSFSGECASCVCRKEVLVAGGKLVSYRGWSVTTFLVVFVLCLRIIYRLFEAGRGKFAIIKSLLESFGWILIIRDSVYVVMNSPPEQYMLRIIAFGGVFLLICLHLLKKACTQVIRWQSVYEKR